MKIKFSDFTDETKASEVVNGFFESIEQLETLEIAKFLIISDSSQNIEFIYIPCILQSSSASTKPCLSELLLPPNNAALNLNLNNTF